MGPVIPMIAAAAWVTPAWAAAPVELTAERVDVVVGRTLVTPVRVLDARAAARGVTAKLDDGRAIEGRVWWIGAVPGERAGGAWSWTPEPGEWTAVAAGRGEAPTDGVGGWHALFDLPFDAFGQGMWIENRRYGLRWVSDPYRVGVAAGAEGRAPAGLWDAPASARADEQMVREAIARDGRDALWRWRARLADGTLDPGVPLGRDAGTRAVTDARQLDEAGAWPAPVEALATQQEALWQAALARVWLKDRGVGEALKHRLAGAASVPGGGAVPVWDTDPLTQSDLLPDLLSPLVEDDAAVLRARAWLATRPAATAWVVDAGGLVDAAGGGAIATLGLLSFAEGGAVRVVGGVAAPVLEVAEPASARTLRATLRGTAGSLAVRVGSTELSLRADAMAAEARPPGVRLGPTLRDWTLQALLSGQAGLDARPAPAEAAAVSLTRRADAPIADALAGWRLSVECVVAEGEVAADSVRVWIGPFGRADLALRVARDGSAVLVDGAAPPVRPEVRVDGTRWTVTLDLPRDLVPPDGVLRVGLERATPAGVRTALPARMTPWQLEPGRVPVDLRAWGGLPTGE